MPSTHLLLPLLSSLLFVGPARTPTSDGHVMLEIVETSTGPAKGKQHRTRFELPANGEIATWTDSGEQRRFCRVESTLDRTRGHRRISLTCKDHPKSQIVELAVEASPPIELRGRMVLADIERPDGRRIEVAMRTS